LDSDACSSRGGRRKRRGRRRRRRALKKRVGRRGSDGENMKLRNAIVVSSLPPKPPH
jgi:hypothetical protein